MDPRLERTKRHGLFAIITTALCEVIRGVERQVQIEEFVDLLHGIPSHDTFGWVYGPRPRAIRGVFSVTGRKYHRRDGTTGDRD